VSVLAKEKNEKLLPTRRKELFICFYVYYWRKIIENKAKLLRNLLFFEFFRKLC